MEENNRNFMNKNSTFLIDIDESYLNEIDDVYNANIEVFVTLEDGFTLVIIVGTPQNLKYIMEKKKQNFYEPGLPWIVVRKLTKEIIEEAIRAYMAYSPDGYWLKLCHFAMDIDITVFNKLQAKEIEDEGL
jgi:hypothetical protein